MTTAVILCDLIIWVLGGQMIRLLLTLWCGGSSIKLAQLQVMWHSKNIVGKLLDDAAVWCSHHRKAWTTVQAFLISGWMTRTMTSLMTLTHTWSMARDTRTGRHLKVLFTDSDAATQLMCGVTHTITHDDSQWCIMTHSHTVGCKTDRT